jgi:hypothetical protein
MAKALPGQYVLDSTSYFLSMAGLSVADSEFCGKAGGSVSRHASVALKGEKFRLPEVYFAALNAAQR